MHSIKLVAFEGDNYLSFNIVEQYKFNTTGIID